MITVEEHVHILPMTWKDKKVLVVGLARSGTGAAKLLAALGAAVSVTDSKTYKELEHQIKELPSSVQVIAGHNPREAFESAELIVLSPGVPAQITPLIHAREKEIPVISEIELAYQVISSVTPVPFIGITGTNGKSTVTTLVDLMLRESGRSTMLGGNIGNALTEEIQRKCINGREISPGELPDYIVAEISSFQLESIQEFKPKISALLNISPDHLDRYESMEEYVMAKAEIFSNQSGDDSLVVNADDRMVMQVIREKLEGRTIRPEVLYFSSNTEVEGVYARDGVLYANSVRFPSPVSPFPIINIDDIQIKGVHNIENAMAASLIALRAGVHTEQIKAVLTRFHGLEHRMEFVRERQGVTFINDSKGTNVGAVARSLESFHDLILIMGGTDKGSDFTVLKEQMRRKVKALVLIGEAADVIEKSLGESVETLRAGDLKHAVKLALSKGSRGDTVLLSPGCASFDMFENFEDRGRAFKSIVHELGE